MEKELEKELEEVVKEMLLPENRQKLLLAVYLGMNLANATKQHPNPNIKAETIHPKYKSVSYGDPLFGDYVKEMIERNEAKLKYAEKVNVNYTLVNKKSPD